MKEFEIAFLLANSVFLFWLFFKWSSSETFIKMFLFVIGTASVITLISKFGITIQAAVK